MLGLPVASVRPHTPIVLLACMLAATAALAQGTSMQPSVETLMYHMTNNRDVGHARKLYRSSVDTAMLYSQCAAEYNVDEAKRRHMDIVLYQDEQALRKALTVAHQELMFKLPSDAVLKAVDQYIADFRTTEAVELGQLIANRKGGCRQATFERLDAAYEQRRAMEEKQREDQSIQKQGY